MIIVSQMIYSNSKATHRAHLIIDKLLGWIVLLQQTEELDNVRILQS